MAEKYDFSGWATKNNLRCSDGRIIRQDAFKDCDGMVVPLVWMHSHDDPENVLGHCLLENREDGVYTYGSFNESKKAKAAKEQINHGDINGLSIWANHLQQSGNYDGSVNVIHGDIKEVSLVLSGANPGAMIDTVLEHSGEVSDDDLIIFAGEELELDDNCLHSDTNNDRDGDLYESDEDDSENEDEDMSEEKSVQEIFDGMSDEQKEAVYYMVGAAVEDSESDEDEDYDEEAEDDDDEEDYEEEDEEDYDDGDAEGEDAGDMAQSDFGDYDMRYNVFDNTMDSEANVLSQSDMDEIFKDAKRCGSLREAVLEHDDGGEEPEITYGIRGIDTLFPDDKAVGDVPNLIARDMAWVSNVMSGVHHSPFSRIKMINADITADEARALGYFKGNLKKEEVFTLLKRRIDPQTIYKKQKFDRDDLVDISDFNVVAFVKTEMRAMLDEEIARAILVGDGRVSDSDDKISEDHVKPIYNDSTLYSIQVPVNVEHGAPPSDKAKAFIDECVRARKNYKGSGNPVAFMTEDMLTECLLLEDGIGHKLYKSEAEVATAIRASKIVTVPVMENITDATKGDLVAILVNLADYTVGADKGGEINMFDDFDIDYNQQKYLMETRISGALTKPKSAMVFSIKEAAE